MKQMVWGILAVIALVALFPMEEAEATSCQVEFYEGDEVVRIILKDDLPAIRWSGSITGPDFKWSSPVVALGYEGKEVFIHPEDGELADLRSGTYTVTLTPFNEKDRSTYEDIVGQFTVGGDSDQAIWWVVAVCAVIALAAVLMFARLRGNWVNRNEIEYRK